MKKRNLQPAIVFVILLSALVVGPLCLARGGFEVLGGGELRRAEPRDFYLAGNAIQVEKRNAVLLRTPSGARELIALLVTSGWASQLPHKYSGMLISEGRISVCGNWLGVGSYAFGVRRPSVNSNRDAEFILYNQAGQRVGGCHLPKDLRLKDPRPLQVVVPSPKSARLYLGRYWAELRQ
jgi:hypothetical protein